MSQLLRQNDTILDLLARGKNVDLTYLDFSKAFNMVDYSVLLKMLKLKGFQGNILMWLRSFLAQRKQQVRISQSLSEEAPLHSGVPQGSVLRSLLFLVFISDLETSLQESSMSSISVYKYVDGSKVLAEIVDEEGVQNAQCALDRV